MIDQSVRPHEAEAVKREYRATVEVVVYPKDRIYRAVCLDFGLIVERPTWKEASEELMAVISGYVRDALEAGIQPEDMRRPVPQSERRYIYRQLAKAAGKQFIQSLFHVGRDGAGGTPSGAYTHSYCAV